MRKELKNTSQYMNELEQRVMEANQRSLDMIKELRDLELETATLKNYIIDLKARVAVYVPIKDD